MTRILLISDIHGNFPALRAVAARADLGRCDHILNCGDCTVYAPFADQVMQWLQDNGVLSIRGNTDDKVIKLLKGKNFKKPGKAEKRIMYTHTAATLGKSGKEALCRLKKKEKLRAGGKKIRIFHGSPAHHTEFLFAHTPDSRFAELADQCRADIIVTGHSHTPYHKVIQGIHFINPGSVGRMFDGDPRASYAILTLERGEVRVDLQRCEYPVEEVVDGLAAAGLPEIYALMYRQGRKLN